MRIGFSLNYFFSLTLFVFCVTLHAKLPDEKCVARFSEGSIKVGSKSCELECSSLMTDMDTFPCPSQCGILCNSEDKKNILGKILYYPGLTPAERKLVQKNPEDALIAFVQKTRAEWSSGRNFPEQGLNDESDAFRHFMWAGLLTKELGAEKTKAFLDAHEANPLQPDTERDIDLFNNERGISAAQSLISNKEWSIENLEKSGLDSLRSKDLKVLNPGLKIPEVPK